MNDLDRALALNNSSIDDTFLSNAISNIDTNKLVLPNLFVHRSFLKNKKITSYRKQKKARKRHLKLLIKEFNDLGRT